jgi:hypothetical protein
MLLVISAGLAAGLAASWFLFLWVISMATRQPHVQAQPPTSDPGPEPPAVAGMLAQAGRVGQQAAAATLLDLAARHVVEFEDAGPQLSLCRIAVRDGAGLAPYERRILSYLEALATGDEVPAPPGSGGCAARSPPTPGTAACAGPGGTRRWRRLSACWPAWLACASASS